MEEPRKLDLTRYQNDELVARVISIVDTPGAIKTLLKITLIACSIVPGIYTGALALQGLEKKWIAGGATYSVVAAFIFGLGIGVVWLGRSILDDIQEIVRLVLKQSRIATADLRDIKAGEVEIPSGQELVEQTYGDLVLPLVESAIASVYGVFGKPLLAIYRVTIGRVVSFVVKKTAAAVASHETIERGPERFKKTIEEMASDDLDQIDRFAEEAQKVYAKYSNKIRKLVLIPLIVLLGILVVLLSLPILLAPMIVGK